MAKIFYTSDIILTEHIYDTDKNLLTWSFFCEHELFQLSKAPCLEPY